MKFANRIGIVAALALGLALAQAASGTTDYDVTIDPVDFDRWMYPFNGTPGSRNAASTFSAIGSWPTDNLDNKDATMIIAVDTAAAGIPTGQHYRYVTVRIRVTHLTGAFDYDPTYDAWQTYLDPSHPDYVADSDAGRPIELYGVGLRSGYTHIELGTGAAGPPDFEENESFCESCTLGQPQFSRSAFPIDQYPPDPMDTDEFDVTNNVEVLDASNVPLPVPGFDPEPWAIGLSTSGLGPGDPVPEGVKNVSAGETFEFTIDPTADLHVREYLEDGLSNGVLAFAITSMHEVEQFVGTSRPNFATSESTDTATFKPSVEIEVTVLPEPRYGLVAGAALLLALARRRAGSRPT